MKRKDVILEEVNNFYLDGTAYLEETVHRIALVLLNATPAEMLGEIMRLPVLDVIKDADVSMVELKLSFHELTLVRSIKSSTLPREPHAVLQNVGLEDDGATLIFRICPGMRRVIEQRINQPIVETSVTGWQCLLGRIGVKV